MTGFCNRVLHLSIVTVVVWTLTTSIQAAPVVIDNFDNGVTYVGGSPSPMPDNTWLEAKNDWNTVATAGSLDGSPAMKILDYPNSDRTSNYNGLYANVTGKISIAGDYVVRCKAKFKEQVQTPGNYARIMHYGIGITVNGVHRSSTGALAEPANWPGGYPILEESGDPYFTSNDEGLKDPIYLVSSEFTASPTDTIQIVFSTWSTYRHYTSEWNPTDRSGEGYVLIDDLELFPVGEEFPVSMSAWELE